MGRFLFWLYLLVLVLVEATSSNPADPDLWHRLAVGKYLCATHQFPVGETFSYLADFHQIADHEWGGALIFYGAWLLAGGTAIVLLKIITLAATLALVALAGLKDRRLDGLMAPFYAIVLLALLPSFLSTLRCMAATNLIFALWLYWFQRERHNRAVPTWAYVATMILWANLHGGFVIGLLWLSGIALIEWSRGAPARKWALRFGLCGAATLINPFGVQLWVSTARALFITRRGFDEWAPVSWQPGDYPGYKLLVLATLAVFGLLWLRRKWKRIDRTVLLILLGALALSFVSTRHTSIFAIVAGALLPGLTPPEPRLKDHASRLGWFAAVTACTIIPLFAALSLAPGDMFTLIYPPTSCPVRAVNFLARAQTRGNLLVPFNYGSYALWKLPMRVSMDGRYDLVYRPETYRRVDDFFQARDNWQEMLRTPSAVLTPLADPICAQMKTVPGWTEAYHDSTDAVFLRFENPKK